MKNKVIALSMLVFLVVVVPAYGKFRDNLDTPAQMSKLAAFTPLVAIARAGNRLVTVGQRGHILFSDDGGKTWVQASVPVSSDLTSVYFPSSKKGWAVGHDGIVLVSDDGGATWTKQLDGRQANRLLVKSLELKANTGKASGTDIQLLKEVKHYEEQGPDKPFLGVWFADEKSGFIVGAFNLIFKTVDGGKTWEPWFDRTDNPRRMHLYAIGPVGSALFIVGEGGTLLKLDPAKQRFVSLSSPYKGSFFGLVNNLETVVVYGMRGNVFRSDNGGASWQKVDIGVPSAIAGGTLRTDGAFVLVNQSGQVLLSTDDGRSYRLIPMGRPMPLAAVIEAGKETLAVVGLFGTRTIVATQP